MDYAAYFFIQVVYAIASLALISVGLAVIYGMMRVINFAHGEFLMLGGYAVILPVQAGFNLWISMLIIAPLSVGLFGIVVERLIIRPLYGRVIDTVLATWGLSLLLIGLTSATLGYYQEGSKPPLGSLAIGAYRESGYTFFVIGITFAVMTALYLGLKRTRFGLLARGTMQNPAMAAGLGVNTGKSTLPLSVSEPHCRGSRAPFSRQSRVWFQSSELPISPRHSSLSSAEAQRRSPVQCRPLSYSALSIRR